MTCSDTQAQIVCGKVTTLQWMVGVNITLTIGLLFLCFNILSRLP